MKFQKAIMLALALTTGGLWSGSANAQELFKAVVATTRVTTNGSGGLSYSHYGNKQIIADAAAAAGLTNVHGLRLVYNKTADDLEVVSGTNNAVVATPLTFVDGVGVARTNHTLLERVAWVFVGPSTNAAGTLRSTERSHFGTSNALTQFSLTGRLQYGTPAAGTNGAAVYSGNLNAGSSGESDEDENHDDEHGD